MIRRRVERLEAALSGRTNLHMLHEVIFAKKGETAVEAIGRVAPQFGITFEQVGCATVVWGNERKLTRREDYQIVEDVSKLIGWKTHEECVIERDRLRREDPEKLKRWAETGKELWRLRREQAEREGEETCVSKQE